MLCSPSNMKLIWTIQILSILTNTKALLNKGNRTNEIELNNFLLALINEISLNSSVMIIELNDFRDVNTQELANALQEKEDRSVSVSLSIEHWLKHLSKGWTRAHVSLIFGRYDYLKTFLKEIWNRGLLSDNQKYVFITDTDSIKLIIREKKIQDVFHLIILSMDEQRKEGIFNLYDIDPQQDGKSIRFGTWHRGLTKTSRDIFPNKFVDLKGKVMNCALMPLFPNVNIISGDSSNEIKIDGIDYDIISTIGEKLNFKIKFIKSIDGKYGTLNLTNKQYNGIIGMAQRQEVDVSIGGIIQTYERTAFIDFSSCISHTKISFLTRKPRLLPKWQALFSPFELSVWIGLLGVLIAYTSVSLFLISLTSRSKKRTSFTYICLNVWASFINQGIKHYQRSSLRILWAAWFLFSFCIVSSYAGSLFSWLTLPKHEPNIDSLEQLLNSQLKIMIPEGTYHNDLLKNSKDKLFQRTYKRIYRGPSLCKSFTDCLYFINDNIGYSFIFEVDTLESFMYTFSTQYGRQNKVRMAKKGFYEIQCATVFRKNHPLKYGYNKYILKIQESGLENFWRSRYLFKKRLDNTPTHLNKYLVDILKNDTTRDMEGQRSLSLEHFQGAFMLYTFGMLCSLIGFVFDEKRKKKASASLKK